MKNNQDLQKDVQEAIKWVPSLKASEIGVIAKDGIVTLTGFVDSYATKSEAEGVAKNVRGVKAVVEKIEIKFDKKDKTSDTDIANAVLIALKSHMEVPNDKIKIKVEDGWVILEGELQWHYEKEAVKNAVKYLIGVMGITNDTRIKFETPSEIEKRHIEHAFILNSLVKNLDIQIEVSGNKVTLNGKVHSFYQKEVAERIAWHAHGVLSVDNELVVDYANL